METKNYFLGSVGMVEAFKIVNGKPELAFVSKTLTDSGINTSITADDIRAGQGAPIVTRFYHDASVEITLTDVMFKRAYVAAQLGAEFTDVGSNDSEAFQTEGPLNPDEGSSPAKITLQRIPLPLKSNGCESSTTPVAWYTKAGKMDWKIGVVTVEAGVASVAPAETDPALEASEEYCVRYLAKDERASVADIMADIIPGEYHLIITVPLYAGDACSASAGKTAGEVQFDIPRFRLNGAQDFAAAMSSNQTVSLAGAAMATQTGCDTSAILYTMRILYKDENEADRASNYAQLEALKSSFVHGEVPIVYGIKRDFTAVRLNNDDLHFYQGASGTTEALDAEGALKDAYTGDVRVIYGNLPVITVTVA